MDGRIRASLVANWEELNQSDLSNNTEVWNG